MRIRLGTFFSPFSPLQVEWERAGMIHLLKHCMEQKKSLDPIGHNTCVFHSQLLFSSYVLVFLSLGRASFVLL